MKYILKVIDPTLLINKGYFMSTVKFITSSNSNNNNQISIAPYASYRGAAIELAGAGACCGGLPHSLFKIQAQLESINQSGGLYVY